MNNVFNKLIRKELGEVNYHRYFIFVRKSMRTEERSNTQAIFNDMYDKLRYRDKKAITKMHNRLNDTMLLALRISRTYLASFIFYVVVSIFLLMKGLYPPIAIAAILGISICFIYKTYEFIAHKVCYVDAQIVLVYKAVLDRILLGEKISANKDT